MLSNCLVSYLVVTFHSLFFIFGGPVGVPAGIMYLWVAGAGTLLYPLRVMGAGVGVGFNSRCGFIYNVPVKIVPVVIFSPVISKKKNWSPV